jgi:hypothetical protein
MTTGWKILAALLLAAVAVWAWDAKTDSDIAKGDKQGYARAKAEFKDAELKAIQEVRKEEGRRIAALQGVIDETNKDLVAARAAADGAVAAGERLRAQLAIARGRGRSGTNPATAGGSAPADTTEGMLADVQRRLDAAAERVGRFADESHIAGEACERAYQSLTP